MTEHAIECRCAGCDRRWDAAYSQLKEDVKRSGRPWLDLTARLKAQQDLVPPTFLERLTRLTRGKR